MTVLAIVTSERNLESLLGWAATFAKAYQTDLAVWCWSYSDYEEYPLLSEEKHRAELSQLGQHAEATINELRTRPEFSGSDDGEGVLDTVKIDFALQPVPTTAAINFIRASAPEMVIAYADEDEEEGEGAPPRLDPRSLLRQSPTDTLVFYKVTSGYSKPRVIAGLVDTSHDPLIARIGARIARHGGGLCTLARTESDAENEAKELGMRELRRIVREAGIKKHPNIRRRVFVDPFRREFRDIAEKSDLIMLGYNARRSLSRVLRFSNRPSVAAVKRSPPLKWITGKKQKEWNTRINPGDYADLVQNLRRGSRLDLDFLAMLGLASAIASLGLLQNSPAVVIGSMLLAPLMTPMIGSGLALAQANPKLGRMCFKSILVGFLMTLFISFMVAIITPGEEMTTEVLARGDPNILDMLIALFSAMAAAYAMGRPNILGAAAGVAIATALVPPLCSVGISLAYRDYFSGIGAALLFITNVVAIMIGAAITFRLMGITFGKTGTFQRKWVVRVTGILFVAVLVLTYPLQLALQRSIDHGKPQPNSYPLAKNVGEALNEYVASHPNISIVAAGRPSSPHDPADVLLVLASRNALPKSSLDELISIVRTEMNNEELVVEVHCLRKNGVVVDE